MHLGGKGIATSCMNKFEWKEKKNFQIFLGLNTYKVTIICFLTLKSQLPFPGSIEHTNDPGSENISSGNFWIETISIDIHIVPGSCKLRLAGGVEIDHVVKQTRTATR